MVMSLYNFFCALTLCVSVTLLNPKSSYAQYFFVFGDSLYDAGNNIFIDPGAGSSNAYQLPYGETFFGRATGRFSDGRVVPDFIATYLNMPYFPPPILNSSLNFTHGASFASGGAGVFDTNPKAMNLDQQYGNLTKLAGTWSDELGETEANKRLREAVYLMAMGGNDYFSFAHNSDYTYATLTQIEDYVQQVIAKLFDVVQKMYNEVGARKFMFANVGCLGCFPMFKKENDITGDGCSRQALVLATVHNLLLNETAKKLKSSNLPELTYSIFDFFSAVGERISHPTNFGFDKGDTACFIDQNDYCSDPSKYVFWDVGHNTDASNGQFAEIMWNGPSSYVYPYTMQELFEYDLPDPKICSNYKICTT